MGAGFQSDNDSLDDGVEDVEPSPSDLDRPITEPPAPGRLPDAGSIPPPGGFTEWLTEWEDVRDDGDDPTEVGLQAEEMGPTESSSDRPESATAESDKSVDPARETQKLPPLPAEIRPDAVGDLPLARADGSGLGGDLGGDLGDEEPTLPNPGARLPSPPPVRSQPQSGAAMPPRVRPSRPRPVSKALRGPSPGFESAGQSKPADQAVQTTSRTVSLGGLDVTVDGTQRAMLITAVVGMVVVAGLFAYLLSGLGSQTDTAARQPDPDAVIDADSPNLNVSATSPAAPTTSELARTTVRIAGLDDTGRALCAGSGVLVAEEGIILTNAHVVVGDEDCPLRRLAVGVTLETSDPPELRYEGRVLAIDQALDLAVVKIVGMLSPDDQFEFEPNFPSAILGDSDEVALGDNLRILGYPVIGGETITQTSGSVSGFVAQDSVSTPRALIKTDASISAGNSGGMAVNAAGEVVGIPTKAGANEQGPAVDCRPVSDTNNDGRIDGEDVCMPIGGFLNSIRPINLARDLLARAEAVQGDADGMRNPGPPVDLSTVSLWNPRFSQGEEDDAPVDQVVTLAEGVTEICLFVDWAGIPNGATWAAVWSYEGEQIPKFTIYKVWEYGKQGRNFWYCAEDRRGHAAGVYEVGLFIDDKLAFVEAIEVTEQPAEVHAVTWVNKSDQDLCGLAVNPLAMSRHAGVNELEPDQILAPGDGVVLDLPAGTVVVEAYDCAGNAVAAELDGLSIPEDMFVDGQEVPFVIGESGTDVTPAG